MLQHQLYRAEGFIDWQGEPIKVKLFWVEPEIPQGWDYTRILPRFRCKEPTPLGLWERINRRIYRDLQEEMGKKNKPGSQQ